MQQTVQPIADTGVRRRSGSARSVGRAFARLVTLPFKFIGFAFHWAVRIVEYGIFAALLALVALGGYLYWAASTQPMQIDPATTGYLPPEGMTLKEFLGWAGEQKCLARDAKGTTFVTIPVEITRVISIRLNPSDPQGWQLMGTDINPLPPLNWVMGSPSNFVHALRWSADNMSWRFLTTGGTHQAGCPAQQLPLGSTRVTTAAE